MEKNSVDKKYNFGNTGHIYDESVLAALQPHTLLAIQNYVQYGVSTSFIRAIADNDLLDAVVRADSWNVHHLREILIIFTNYCPRDCWGSPAARSAWENTGGKQAQTKKGEK